MNKIVCIAVSLSLLVATAAAQEKAQEKYTLKNRYPEGRYEMAVESTMDMVMEMFGQKIPMTQVQKQEFHIVASPKKAADDSQTVTMELKRMVSKQQSMGTSMEYDSGDESKQSEPLKVLGAMIGMTLTLTLDKEGKIVKVDGLDELWARLERAPGYSKQILEVLKKQMTEDTLTAGFDAQRNVMPPRAVAVGEQWKSSGSSVVPMLGKVETETDNTLQSVDTVDGAEVARIVSKSRIESSESSKIDMGIVKMDVKKSTIEMESDYRMETKTGLVVSTVSLTQMEMETEVGSGDRKMEQKMTSNGKTTMTVKRIKE